LLDHRASVLVRPQTRRIPRPERCVGLQNRLLADLAHLDVLAL
jgi:hypothetical protein